MKLSRLHLLLASLALSCCMQSAPAEGYWTWNRVDLSAPRYATCPEGIEWQIRDGKLALSARAESIARLPVSLTEYQCSVSFDVNPPYRLSSNKDTLLIGLRTAQLRNWFGSWVRIYGQKMAVKYSLFDSRGLIPDSPHVIVDDGQIDSAYVADRIFSVPHMLTETYLSKIELVYSLSKGSSEYAPLIAEAEISSMVVSSGFPVQ